MSGPQKTSEQLIEIKADIRGMANKLEELGEQMKGLKSEYVSQIYFSVLKDKVNDIEKKNEQAKADINKIVIAIITAIVLAILRWIMEGGLKNVV